MYENQHWRFSTKVFNFMDVNLNHLGCKIFETLRMQNLSHRPNRKYSNSLRLETISYSRKHRILCCAQRDTKKDNKYFLYGSAFFEALLNDNIVNAIAVSRSSTIGHNFGKQCRKIARGTCKLQREIKKEN